jgi:DNA-binding NarL/FixJ family response regulator
VSTLPHTQLTTRERAIVRGISRGRSNREIASELGISEQTVKNQLTVIFHKLHIKNRLELAVWAIRHSLPR